MIKIDRRWTYGLTALVATALVVAGCASSDMAMPDPSLEPQRDGNQGADQGLEEITVTGTKVENGRSRRQSSGGNLVAKPQAMAAPLFQRSYSRPDADAAVLPYTSDEEIWVIQKPTVTSAVTPADDPGTGSMVATVDSKEVPLPQQDRSGLPVPAARESRRQ